jgi:hypothetical protein
LGLAFLWLLVAGLASPPLATAESEEEPAAPEWDFGLAQSSGSALWRDLLERLFGGTAAKTRFGLGLDAFFEHQESLQITRQETAFTILDLRLGGEESGVLHGDPGLLNRKFDILWESGGAGVELPIVLPSVGGSVRSTLSLRAAAADVTLDFGDRTRPQDSTSLGGQGALFGVELNVASGLCRDCLWFTEASLRFEKLPSFTVDRSPAFAPQGFEVLEDEVRLGREAREISARVGYSLAGNSVSYYLGALHRWTDLEIEDELRYRDPLRTTETRLSSRTELESEATLGLAGAEYRVSDRLEGRLETSLGEEDWGVVFKLVYLGTSGLRDPLKPSTEEERRIASETTPRIRRIRSDFVEARNGILRASGPGYPVEAVVALLIRTEKSLLAALTGTELAAMRDYVEDQFRRARDQLVPDFATQAGMLAPERLEPRVIPARNGSSLSALRPAAQNDRRDDRLQRALDLADHVSERLAEIFENNDVQINLCVKTVPRPGARVNMYPQSYEEGFRELEPTNNRFEHIWRGLYAYKVSLEGYRDITCPSVLPRPNERCYLNLVDADRPLMKCDFVGGRCHPEDEPSWIKRWRWSCESEDP